MNQLQQHGYIEATNPDPELIPARVTAVHRERYELLCEYGIQHGKLKTSIYYGREPHPFPTVGDFVYIKNVDSGDCQIVETLPRRSYFSRVDPGFKGFREQAIAANFDTVFIMQSLNQNFNLRRLERYLTLSWQSGATPVIILTKVDLIESPLEQISQVESIAAGINIVATSAKTGAGLESLDIYLQPGKTCVFLGSSGVGKSSLLNTLMGEDVMAVKEIREDDSMGRHTTTHRQLFTLPCGTHIIDTPGMRELGMWEKGDGIQTAVSDVFAYIEVYLGTCKFSDCRHQSEPGCAIQAAIRQNEITPERWESYQKLLREAQYAESKLESIREKSARHKEMATWSRQVKTKKRIW
ncbi:MAG: ribosome small subunit-dependent GTPase A [Oscillospiraceae bacterium]|jgi:ribosome biogenesis GTPase|nr:ribosome small subunit-dependent GTPase A [Oscillospiraceae bacterium]